MNGATVVGATVSIGATLMEGATLEIGEQCTCCWNPVAIVLTQLELRSSDGRWPVPPRSVPYG